MYDAVLSAPTSLPSPWKVVGIAAIGGLTDVGFIPDTDFLLVLSSQGRGVYECTSGERVARDREEEFDFYKQRLSAPAFDQFSDQTVRTAGLHGGGLAHTTKDRWHIEHFVFNWPEQIVTLSPPGHWAYYAGEGRPCDVYCLAGESELRAFGFSPTGRSIVIATSSDLKMISRD